MYRFRAVRVDRKRVLVLLLSLEPIAVQERQVAPVYVI